MKDCIKRAIVIGFIFICCAIGESYAKVHPIDSQRDFDQHIGKNGICVLLFYDGDKKNKALQKQTSNLVRMFEDISSQPSYDHADVMFIKVNVARKGFDGFVQQYNIASLPSFMLFRDGRHLKNNGQDVQLNGFVPRQTLQEFIDTYCGELIKKLNETRDKVRERRIEEEKSTWLPYFYSRTGFVEGYDPDERNME